MNYRVALRLAIVPALILGGCAAALAQELPAAGAGQGDTKTLPPHEAAAACLATANEMLRGGYATEAIALFERARQLDPSHKEVSRFLAVLYDECGNDGKALAEYSIALSLTPKDPDLCNDMGYFYMERSDMAAAEKWFHAAIDLAPRHERASMNLAMLLGRAGRYAESYDAFCKVVGPAAAHSNIGMILAKQQRRDEAILAFHRALDLDPSLKQPRAVLAYLERAPTSH